jgi:hypothetical protein
VFLLELGGSHCSLPFFSKAPVKFMSIENLLLIGAIDRLGRIIEVVAAK